MVVSACGTTNHLDQYDLKGAPMYFTANIDHPSQGSDDSSSDDDSTTIWAKLFFALLSLPFRHWPIPFGDDASLPVYFSNGLSAELEDRLWIKPVEMPDDSRFLVDTHIALCDFNPTDSGSNVRVKETLKITHTASGNVVFDEDRTLEVPLRYCGSVQDTVSTSGPAITKDRYHKLTEDEQLSALQCAVYDAGADLADSLNAMVGRAKAKSAVK